MNSPSSRDPAQDKPLPRWLMLLLPFYVAAIFSVFLFPAAGDWRWPEGWAYVIATAINMGIAYAIINERNPRVIRNRAKLKKEGLTGDTAEAAGSDRFIMPLLGVGFFGAMIVPALGRRFGWPTIPPALEIAGLLLSQAGMIIVNVATLQNSYASKILDINQDQVLVDTGFYAHVRHPLYSGGVLMAVGLPVALGSWWGLIPAGLAALSLVLRIGFEEEMLVQGMEGYEEYRQRVRFKLIPGIY